MLKKVILGLLVLAILSVSATAWAENNCFFTAQQGAEIKSVLKAAFPNDQVTVRMSDDWHFCLVQCWAGGKYVAFRVINPRVETAAAAKNGYDEELAKKAEDLRLKIKAILKPAR